MLILKCIMLGVAIYYGISIVGNVANGRGVHHRLILLESIALTIFLSIQFNLF